MADKKKDDDGVLDIDVEEWKAQLNLPDDTNAALLELIQRFDALNNSFGEWLEYINHLDERLQRLDGEAIITATVQQHISPDGIAALHRMMPDVPESVGAPQKPSTYETVEKGSEKSRLAQMVANS